MRLPRSVLRPFETTFLRTGLTHGDVGVEEMSRSVARRTFGRPLTFKSLTGYQVPKHQPLQPTNG